MNLLPERLISVRESHGINKAEAARRLNMSAMGYGRYEKGERVPSYQTLSFMAQVFGTTPEYLCGKTDNSSPASITIAYDENPALFSLIETIQNIPEESLQRLIAYIEQFK